MIKQQEQRVLCVGELVIDFICTDINTDLVHGENYVKKAGGAPANVAVTLSNLGVESYFAGKVGADAFGDFLELTLKEKNVDTRMLARDLTDPTTLAFVSLDSTGERDFIFNRGADANHQREDLDMELVEACSILHFGSATALLGGDSRETYLELLTWAKENNRFVSFDPNYRPDLWKGRVQKFIHEVLPLLSGVDFLKVSEEELQLISGRLDLEAGIQFLHQQGSKIIAVTLGERGTIISNGTENQLVESMDIQAIDATGAGDAFVGAFLSKVAEREDKKTLPADFAAIAEITSFANRVGAMVCLRQGAIDAIPNIDEIINIADELQI